MKPYVTECCNKKLNMNFRRTVTVLNISNSYLATITSGICELCKRKYFHNYFIHGKEKFVTVESIFDRDVVYLGGDYAYEKTLIKWLLNSIFYLYTAFENFSKFYNDTKNWMGYKS